MAQLFSRRATIAFRAALVSAALILAGAFAAGLAYVRTPGFWNVGEPAPQPIPFSHKLHAGKMEIGCGYCHNTVAQAASAGMPTAHTCLSCHAQIWRGASVLEPVRTSMALGQPLRWSSVHRLPTHAYFHHGAHVTSGVNCATCHGEVETMEKTAKARTMSMGWCLDCHRSVAQGQQTAAKSSPLLATAQPLLMSCSTCHR